MNSPVCVCQELKRRSPTTGGLICQTTHTISFDRNIHTLGIEWLDKEFLLHNYVKSSVCVCTERKERREILCSNGIFTRQLEISSDEIPRRTKREYLEERKHYMWLIIWRRKTWISNNALQNSFSKFSLVQRALSLELNHFLTSYEKITLSWHD